MSNTKTVMSQAANTLVKPLDVEDVFSTYLYTGNGSTQTITNGIDLDGEGGLVWGKNRTQNFWNHRWYDTERGVQKYIASSDTSGEGTEATGLTAFNSDGFTLGSNNDLNNSGDDFASWTFRKAPKFFDVVTYTGDGVAGRTVSHNLGAVPAVVIMKCTNDTRFWIVYHKDVGNDKELQLNTTAAAATNTAMFNSTTPTDTEFTLGTDLSTNGAGKTYVAYLFAHNDGDGEFGADGDADIIKCGSLTTVSSGFGEVDLGFEPQWVLVKRSDGTQNWYMYDTMRGITDSGKAELSPNLSTAESISTAVPLYLTPTGFQFNADYFGASREFIYIAIRRGTKVPESATEVFDVEKTSGTSSPVITTGFPTDLYAFKTTDVAQGAYWSSRLTNKALISSSTAAETSNFNSFDSNTTVPTSVGSTGYVHYNWKRAPKFFDAVAYTGDGTAGRTVSHNLGVAPELLITKSRTNTSQWRTYVSSLGPTKYLELQSTAAVATSSLPWNDTAPTATDFTLGSTSSGNASGEDYIAYLFASLPGISKVGSYTGDGTTDGSKVIDCGFTSGARFVLIKRTDGGGSWYVWDTARGIVAGNDPRLKLESTDEEASFDNVDPHNSGFSVVGSSINNINGANYIFYAIA